MRPIRFALCAASLVGQIACASAPRRAPRAADEGPVRPDAPVVREIVVNGATAYPREQVLRLIHMSPGGRLHKTPEAVAQGLETRYRIAGYLAATVAGRFDPGAAVLTLDVDEGRLGELVIEGVSGSAERRAREVLALSPGAILTDKDVRTALNRLEDASGGALERVPYPDSYTAEPGPAGARLTVHLVQHRTRLAFAPGGPGTAPLLNRVDGFAPWASAELTRFDAASFNHLNAYARGSYAFSSHDVHYALGVRRPFGGAHPLTLGYELHDFTDTNDALLAGIFEETPALMLVTPHPQDFYRRHGQEAYASVAPSPSLQLGVSFRADRYSSEDVTSRNRLVGHRANPRISEGDMRSLLGTVRFARGGPLFDSLSRERESFLDRSLYGTRRAGKETLRVDATVEVATPSLGGDFSFRRGVAQLRTVHAVAPLTSVRGRLLLGLSSGDVPLQRLFFGGGVATLRARPADFRAGKEMALVSVELARGFKDHRIPGIVAFYDGGSLWTSGVASRGWDHDLGLGAEWPAGTAFFVRTDVACALDSAAGASRCRFNGQLRLPF